MSRPASRAAAKASPNVTAPRVTSHACLRYAQRVLGLEMDGRVFNGDADLQGRCERGIDRLFERACRASDVDDVEIWLAGTRALIVKDGHVLTVLVAPTDRGFGKRFLRRYRSAAWAA